MREESSVERIRRALTEKSDMLGAMLPVALARGYISLTHNSASQVPVRCLLGCSRQMLGEVPFGVLGIPEVRRRAEPHLGSSSALEFIPITIRGDQFDACSSTAKGADGTLLPPVLAVDFCSTDTTIHPH